MALGILIRSSAWINGQLPMSRVQSDNDAVKPAAILCAISSVSSSLMHSDECFTLRYFHLVDSLA